MTQEICRIQFLYCPIDSVTMSQTVEQCLQWCQETRQPRLVVTVNATTLVMMYQDQKLLEASVQGGDLIVPDGLPVVWASRWLGTPLVERIAGCDLLPELIAASVPHQLGLYFLGAQQNVLEKLVQICREKYPSINIVGFHHGYFGPEEYPNIVKKIRESGAHFLFIGMPTPFKEVWAYQHKADLNVPIILGVGGSFDVLAGFVRRAPKWVQRIGMEWFWRFLMEPRKLWKRAFITNAIFIKLVLRELWHKRKERK